MLKNVGLFFFGSFPERGQNPGYGSERAKAQPPLHQETNPPEGGFLRYPQKRLRFKIRTWFMIYGKVA